jgi:hypothetical protein
MYEKTSIEILKEYFKTQKIEIPLPENVSITELMEEIAKHVPQTATTLRRAYYRLLVEEDYDPRPRTEKSAVEVLREYFTAHNIQLPLSDDVSITELTEEIAKNVTHAATTLRRAYYKLLVAEGITNDEEPEQQPEEPGGATVDGEEPPNEPQGVVELKRDYFYNELDDVYVVYLSHIGWLPVQGETIREMKRRYSVMPAGYDTINQIATAFGWRRKDFERLKTVLGWTHDQDPYTDEEHASIPTPELVQDYASIKRGEFERQVRKKEWAETVKDAKSWREWKDHVIDPLGEFIIKNPPRGRSSIPTIEKPAAYKYMAVLSPSDAHLHKACIDGRGFKEAREDLIATTEDLLERLVIRGTPERLVLILGNDWFHIDNVQGGTSAQTPQDIDGIPDGRMVAQGWDTAVEIIDLVRSLGPVEVMIVPSNHGRWSDFHLHAGLRLGYRNTPDVFIHGVNPKERQYIKYGLNLIGVEHGDGPKATDLPLIMAKEKRKEWGQVKHTYWLTGHRHHLKEIDCGSIVMQAPSLAGKDRWHNKKGYVLSERANICYVFDRNRGHLDRLISVVDD